MIIALVNDPVLRAAVEAAARWDEDVLSSPVHAWRALQAACPRVVIVDGSHGISSPILREAEALEVPILRITDERVTRWEAERRERVPPLVRVRDYSIRLRALIPTTPPSWVDRTLADLARAVGQPLPRSFRALARRVLEDPVRYTSLESLTPLTGLQPGALRARFRRRELPSPVEYLRWLRLIAVAQRLQRRGEPVSTVAFAMGFTSGGNLSRFTRSLSGSSPGQLRKVTESMASLLLGCAQAVLQADHLEGWDRLDKTFGAVA